MTNSEAIEWLKEIPRAYGIRRDEEPCEAFVLAIKALDENEKLNKEIPALLNRIDELQEMIACRDVEIAQLKEKKNEQICKLFELIIEIDRHSIVKDYEALRKLHYKNIDWLNLNDLDNEYYDYFYQNEISKN